MNSTSHWLQATSILFTLHMQSSATLLPLAANALAISLEPAAIYYSNPWRFCAIFFLKLVSTTNPVWWYGSVKDLIHVDLSKAIVLFGKQFQLVAAVNGRVKALHVAWP